MFGTEIELDPPTSDLEGMMAEAEMFVEPFRQVLPDELETIPPGPYLAVILAGLDRTRLNGHDVVRMMQSHKRLAAHYEAASLADMVEVAHCPPGDADSPAERNSEPEEFASDDIRAALCLTRRSAENELEFALELRGRLPQAWELLGAGLIDLARAKTIVYGTSHLSDQTARDVVVRIVDRAPNLTTGQLSARIRRLCVEADPGEAKSRYEEAVEERRIVTQADVDGTASLFGLNLPPHRVIAVTRRINKIARGLKHSDDARTADQIRADVFLDLLAGVELSDTGSRATVDIRVDMATLMGADDNAAEIPGFGPVIADIARKVVQEQQDAEWRYTIIDGNGQAITTGTTRRRPTTSRQRKVEAKHPTCVFPGCRMPSADCDLDHREQWVDGGPTTEDNLAPLCRHDHIVKHSGWTLARLPNGDHQWSSRLGHTYLTAEKPP
ncbi:MAG: DUF222 domain-containing protein [Acidobacteria bacterium]|nr:DUF222 domain-containing protein [Acidobacteriota bacterium]